MEKITVFLIVCLISGIGSPLFCSGRIDERSGAPYDRSGYYNAEWLDTVIDGSIPLSELPERITVTNYNASLTVRTDPAADSLRYTIKGLPAKAVSIQKSSTALMLTEREIRPRDRQTGNSWDMILADIELVIPASGSITELNVRSVIGDTRMSGVSCDTFEVRSDVSRLSISDSTCKTFIIKSGVSALRLSNIACSTCEVTTSTAHVFIENFQAAKEAVFHTSTGNVEILNGALHNPFFDLTGGLDFTGTLTGTVQLEGGINTVAMDLQNSSGIRRFDITGSVGKIRLKRFSAESLTLDTSTGSTRLDAVNAGKAAIRASTGSVHCTHCTLQNARVVLSTGAFDFSGLLKADCTIEQSTGRVDLDISAPQKDYCVYFENVPSFTRSVYVNGRAVNSTIGEEAGAKHKLRIKGSTGRCSIRFLE
ncbi:MAG: DUF4097 family beta strand repeat-containing protein [Treponema sp.]